DAPASERGSLPDRRTRVRARPSRCLLPRARAAPARSHPARRSRRPNGCRSRSRSPFAGRPGLLGVELVRLDDALNELVPHDILVAELHELDAFDRTQDVLHLDQPRGLLARNVVLRYVAGIDDLRG